MYFEGRVHKGIFYCKEVNMKVIMEEGQRPIKIWATQLEDEALQQAKNLARLPFIPKSGIALMADAHSGKGSTIGSVIATEGAIIPAAVGVDIGCGMVAVRLSLKAGQLPDNLAEIRAAIESAVPLGPGGAHSKTDNTLCLTSAERKAVELPLFGSVDSDSREKLHKKAASQLGTLGSGNHFIELCIDENQDVWVMLHSGSRGIGNMIGTHYIEKAKKNMEKFFISLPDADLAYLPEETEDFEDYMRAVGWAQNYAAENRRLMLIAVLQVLKENIAVEFTVTQEAINTHHNYVTRENHYGRNMWITRKGAIRAREGDLGIIPGSMGQRSYIVQGKGNLDAYCSCSHGAGRAMSRASAKKKFNLTDLIAQTQGVECRKDESVLDEIPGAYKNIDEVMAAQEDLVEVVHTLKQVLCVKGN